MAENRSSEGVRAAVNKWVSQRHPGRNALAAAVPAGPAETSRRHDPSKKSPTGAGVDHRGLVVRIVPENLCCFGKRA